MLQVVETSGSSPMFQQLDVNSYVTSMALSPLGDYLVFGDAEGSLHFWTTHDTNPADGQLNLPPFNGYDGVKPEWPDPIESPQIPWDEKT
jgi:PAB-dependent poly(A)-specific ribonuclease subunit 2